jgi:hypothetical protein
MWPTEYCPEAVMQLIIAVKNMIALGEDILSMMFWMVSCTPGAGRCQITQYFDLWQGCAFSCIMV